MTAGSNPLGSSDSGFTLVEALVALSICGFVLVALGNLTWFLVARQQRLSASELDLQEAFSFSQTVEKLVKGADPRHTHLGEGMLVLDTVGLPESVPIDGKRTVRLSKTSEQGRTRLLMDVEAPDAEVLDEAQTRRQPLLTSLVYYNVTLQSEGVATDSWDGEGKTPETIRFRWQRSGGRARDMTFSFGKPPVPTECLRAADPIACGAVH